MPEPALPAAFQFIDKIERLRGPELESAREDSAAFAPATATDLEEVSRIRGLDQARAALHGDGSPGLDGLQAVVDAVTAQGLDDWLEIDLTIVRGLAYYTGTVFELFDAQRKLRAICGGGRYNTLLKSVGGADLPAVGFGMGDVVLGELLRDRGLHPPVQSPVDVFAASITADDVAAVLALAHQLRDAGVRVEYAFNATAVGKQLALAASRGARFAVVIGPDDRERGEVQLKDLAHKTQTSIARDAVVAQLSSLVLSHG